MVDMIFSCDSLVTGTKERDMELQIGCHYILNGRDVILRDLEDEKAYVFSMGFGYKWVDADKLEDEI